jgi:hypothetical protein
VPNHFENVREKVYFLNFEFILSLLVSAQLESLFICISLDYLMTLQEFFISGLPSGNAETKPQIEQQPATTTDLTESEKNRAKLDKKPSTAPPKPPPAVPKRMKFSSEYSFIRKKIFSF